MPVHDLLNEKIYSSSCYMTKVIPRAEAGMPGLSVSTHANRHQLPEKETTDTRQLNARARGQDWSVSKNERQAYL